MQEKRFLSFATLEYKCSLDFSISVVYLKGTVKPFGEKLLLALLFFSKS